jgi:hypothetical protein
VGSFDASQNNFDIKTEYKPYSSRDLLGKKKIDFEQKLIDAAERYNSLQG